MVPVIAFLMVPVIAFLWLRFSLVVYRMHLAIYSEPLNNLKKTPQHCVVVVWLFFSSELLLQFAFAEERGIQVRVIFSLWLRSGLGIQRTNAIYVSSLRLTFSLSLSSELCLFTGYYISSKFRLGFHFLSKTWIRACSLEIVLEQGHSSSVLWWSFTFMEIFSLSFN